MPRFAYISRSTTGERVTAVAEAETRQGLLSLLRGRGLTVVDIQELAEPGRKKKQGPKTLKDILHMEIAPKRVSTEELAVFWRQVTTMVEAGLPVIEAIESIAEETDHVTFKKVLGQVTAGMWEGLSLSQSMRHHHRVFSPMIIALVAAAEESGSLPEVTAQIATFLENRDRLIRKVRAALTYPIFLAGFFLFVLAVATFWIIPMFRNIYEGFNAELPWITERVFAANAFILHYLPWLAGAAVIAFALLVSWVRRPSGKKTLDRVILSIPIFGGIIRLAGIARLCRSLAILLYGGIPINRALEMAEETSGNNVIAQGVRRTREEIMRGSKIAAALRKEKVFPKMAVRMVSAGEETGNMCTLLNKAADFYESRVDAAVSTINSLIEPLIIILIGGFVLIFVLSLYMPIFTLASSMN